MSPRQKPLKKGSTIGIIAPGSPTRPDREDAGEGALKDMGYLLRAPLSPSEAYGTNAHGFASASIASRVDALHQLAADDAIGVVIAARGAYGSLELLPHLDFSLLQKKQLTIVGYSDVSVLLLALHGRGAGLGIHGPTISKEFAEYNEQESSKESVDALVALLSDPTWRFDEPVTVLRDGSVEAPLVATNLTSLVSLLGTEWFPDLSGVVLFLEDIGEAPFRVQRSLQQLYLAGVLKKLGGIVFGRFDRCEAAHGPSVKEVFAWVQSQLLSNTSYPVVMDFPFGHNGRNIPLPFGCTVRVENGRVQLCNTPLSS